MTKCLTYRITFLDEYGSKKVDCFHAPSKDAAIGMFRDCYRHGCYKIVQIDVIT